MLSSSAEFDGNSPVDYSEAKYSGKHMICDLKGVRNIALMSDVPEICRILDVICDKYKYQVLGKSSHVFSPFGATVLYLLSESHISVHTFPERRYVAVDIYTCREMPDNSIYLDIYGMLIGAFEAAAVLNVDGPVIFDRCF